MTTPKYVTLAIHTYDKAIVLKNLLEKEGIDVVLDNVDLQKPKISSGVRVRIKEKDLPQALTLIDESTTTFVTDSFVGESIRVVLIPVDFSEYSIKTCHIGFKFAKEHNCGVVILHSYISQYFSGTLPLGETLRAEKKMLEYMKEKGRKANETMRQFKSEIYKNIEAGELPDVPFKCEVVEGIPEDAIIEYAKTVNPVLIVMGTRGKHKKEQDLIGSVTAEVLDSVKYPMLVVPEGTSFMGIDAVNSFVFYTNLEQPDLLSMDIFMRKFNGKGKNIFLVHVASKREKMVSERMNAIYDYCVQQYEGNCFSNRIFTEDNFLDEFEIFLQENKIGVVVIPNKKRNIFARLFNPSLAHRILFHTDIPMIVVPIK